VIAVLKHKLSGFNLDVIAGETYPNFCPLPTEFPLQQFVNFLGLQQHTEELLKLLDSYPMLAGHLSILLHQDRA